MKIDVNRFLNSDITSQKLFNKMSNHCLFIFPVCALSQMTHKIYKEKKNIFLNLFPHKTFSCFYYIFLYFIFVFLKRPTMYVHLWIFKRKNMKNIYKCIYGWRYKNKYCRKFIEKRGNNLILESYKNRKYIWNKIIIKLETNFIFKNLFDFWFVTRNCVEISLSI